MMWAFASGICTGCGIGLYCGGKAEGALIAALLGVVLVTVFALESGKEVKP